MTRPVRMLPARRVAEMIGIKTHTLGTWRFLGKGPRGWRHVSATLVVYPEPAVMQWLAERGA